MTASTHSDPTLIRIDGRFHWQFDNGKTVPVIHGAADEPKTELPESLSEIEDDALAEMLETLTAEFDKLMDDGSRDVATLAALADDIERVRNEGTARVQAEAEADAAVDDLAKRVHGSDEDSEDSDEPEAEAEPEAEPAAEDTADDEEGEKAEKKELVTASARPVTSKRPPLGDVAKRGARPKVASKTPTVAITAAADLPGVSPGTRIDLNQVAESMHDRARNLSDDGRRAPVARIEIPHTHKLGTDPMANVGMIDEVIGQPEAAALVASGGWCAPSVPIFELFDIGPDTDNIFDLPSLGTTVRSGVMIPSFYDITDADGALWTWTEQNDIDAEGGTPTKPCLKIPCPTFTECVMEAEGLCVTHGNLSDRAWPELTRQFLSIVMGAHQRRLSAAKIAKLLADTTSVTVTAAMTPSDAAGDLLNVISLAAADMRSQYRVSKGRSVDVLLPDWTMEVLRSNMAMRQGVWDAMNVSDSQIKGWLAARGVRVQFTPDWQPLYDAAAATEWPTDVTFAIWFTGSYITLDGGSIDLGVVRDSTLNSTNDFTAAWSEQFYQVCRRGPQGRQYTVELGIDGITGCCPTAEPVV